MGAQPPGWYPDPADQGRFRWWTGAAWSAWLGNSADLPAPQVPAATVPPAPAKRARWILPVLATLLALLLVGGGLGYVGATQGAPLPAPVPPTPAPGKPSVKKRPPVMLDWNTTSRRVGLYPLFEARLPGRPFEALNASPAVGLAKSTAITVMSKDPKWVKQVNLPPLYLTALLDPYAEVPGDLRATNENALSEFGQRFYKNLPNLKTEPIQSQPETRLADYPSVTSTRVITGTLKDGTPQKATLTMTTIRIQDDLHISFLDIRPDWTSPATAKAMDAVRATIRRPG